MKTPPPTNKEAATLRALRTYVTPNIYYLSQSDCVIGRDSSCDVLVNTPLTSRKHAQVLYEDNYVLLDESSSYGTFINRNLITKGVKYRLKNGDAIGFGESLPLLRFLDPSITTWRPKLEFDKEIQQFVYGHVPLSLTPIQHSILEFLYQPYGRVRLDDDTIDHVWKTNFVELLEKHKADATILRDIHKDRSYYQDQLYRRIHEISKEMRSIAPEFSIIARRKEIGYLLTEAKIVAVEE